MRIPAPIRYRELHPRVYYRVSVTVSSDLLLIPVTSISGSRRLSARYDAPCLFPACPVMCTPISPSRPLSSPVPDRDRWSACKFPRGGRGNEPRRCLLRFAPSHSIKMRDSVIECSGLIVPPPAARKSPFSAAIFLHLPFPILLQLFRLLRHLVLLLRMFFNRPHVFFLGGWHANCRGRHVRNLRYGNSLRF